MIQVRYKINKRMGLVLVTHYLNNIRNNPSNQSMYPKPLVVKKKKSLVMNVLIPS